MFGLFKKQKGQDCIRDMHHITGAWQQYDFLLTFGYGWEYMLSSAQYMSEADLEMVSTVTVGDIGAKDREYIGAVRENGGRLDTCEALRPEGGSLGIGGISRTLGCPTKIVWFNQSSVLRVFIGGGARDDMKGYARRVIGRAFEKAER